MGKCFETWVVMLACCALGACGGDDDDSGGGDGDGVGVDGGSGGASGGSGGTGSSGSGGMGGDTGSGGTASSGGGDGDGVSDLEPFSFFVTSLEGLQQLSGSVDGFGGDLRHGEADGLSGADKICSELAEGSMPGSAAKGWRAFLSVSDTAPGGAVDAIDRVGTGPWYDRLGRVVAMDTDALLNERPEGADNTIINDLPNEFGIPNHAPDGVMQVDNHHVMTGSGEDGRLYQGATSTCLDWTSAVGADGSPRSGFSWPRGARPGGGPGGPGGNGGAHWMTSYSAPGCAPEVDVGGTGRAPDGSDGVGSGGGYGAIYCFALSP